MLFITECKAVHILTKQKTKTNKPQKSHPPQCAVSIRMCGLKPHIQHQLCSRSSSISVLLSFLCVLCPCQHILHHRLIKLRWNLYTIEGLWNVLYSIKVLLLCGPDLLTIVWDLQQLKEPSQMVVLFSDLTSTAPMNFCSCFD